MSARVPCMYWPRITGISGMSTTWRGNYAAASGMVIAGFCQAVDCQIRGSGGLRKRGYFAHKPLILKDLGSSACA
jgi:hypothetical protein